MNNNEIVDNSWLGKKVTCEINTGFGISDSEWTYVEDAEISISYKEEDCYIILQNIAGGGAPSDNPNYKNGWIFRNGSSDTRNLKLVEEPEEEFPVGFRFMAYGHTYEVTSKDFSDSYSILNIGTGSKTVGGMTTIGLRNHKSSNIERGITEIIEYNAKLFKPKVKYKFNDFVEFYGLYYIVASDINELNNTYICYSIKDGTYIPLRANNFRLSSYDEAKENQPTHCIIKSVKDSSTIFGYGSRKSAAIGQALKFVNRNKTYRTTYAKGEVSTFDTVVLEYQPVGSGRWLTSDVEFILELPVILLQKHGKDLTVKLNDTVRLINNKKLPFERNAKCQVVKIIESKNKKYTIKNTKNRPLDVVHLKNLKTGRIEPTYMKNVKLITNE
jgi:hypothetical protein